MESTGHGQVGQMLFACIEVVLLCRIYTIDCNPMQIDQQLAHLSMSL